MPSDNTFPAPWRTVCKTFLCIIFPSVWLFARSSSYFAFLFSIFSLFSSTAYHLLSSCTLFIAITCKITPSHMQNYMLKVWCVPHLLSGITIIYSPCRRTKKTMKDQSKQYGYSWQNVIGTTDSQIPWLSEISGAVHLVLLGLTAGRQMKYMQISKKHCTSKLWTFCFVQPRCNIITVLMHSSCFGIQVKLIARLLSSYKYLWNHTISYQPLLFILYDTLRCNYSRNSQVLYCSMDTSFWLMKSNIKMLLFAFLPPQVKLLIIFLKLLLTLISRVLWSKS